MCLKWYGNAVSLSAETFTKIEIKKSLEIFGKLNETMACPRNHGVAERSRDPSEKLKSI